MQAMTLHTPLMAAIWQKVLTTMDVILHLGTHRTATTSFQHYLRENAGSLSAAGIGFWGPWRTRDGLLTGVQPCRGPHTAAEQFRRARGRIALNLHRARAQGVKQLIVSDENMIGAPRRNVRESRLYGAIGERMARYSQAFGGQVTRLVVSVRSQDRYWSSALAFAVARGHSVPTTDDLDRLVTTNRHWREVITDLACAMPEAEILVQPYEVFGGRPEAKLTCMTAMPKPPRRHAREWMNRAPSVPQLHQILKDRGESPQNYPEGNGRWNPFNPEQAMALREAYADDLFWLRSGAEGLAILIEETGPVKEGKHPPAGPSTRGQNHGIYERRLA